MEQRRNDIVSFVNENGSVTFAQIKERFAGVSEMTLRTDLKVLDQQNRIIRIHGGAKSLDQVTKNRGKKDHCAKGTGFGETRTYNIY